MAGLILSAAEGSSPQVSYSFWCFYEVCRNCESAIQALLRCSPIFVSFKMKHTVLKNWTHACHFCKTTKVDSNSPTSRRVQANVKTTTCSVLSVFIAGFILSIALYEQKQPNKIIIQTFCGRDFNTVVIKAADHMTPTLLSGNFFFSLVLTLIGVCQQSFRFNNCPE